MSNINQKIRINNRINDNLHQLIIDTYSNWFYKFNYPNSIYKNCSNPIIINKDFEKILPDGWKIESIYKNTLFSFIDVGVNKFISKNYLATANVNGIEIEDGDNITYENRESRANMQPSLNSVWFAKMKNSIKHIFMPSNSSWMIDKYIYSTGFAGLQCSELTFPYVASIIMQPYFEKTKDKLAHGATQESVNNDDLNSIPIIVPTIDIIEKYKNVVGPLFNRMNQIFLENQKLSVLRNELLPLLMNGQVILV